MGSDAGFEGCAGYGGLISIHAPRMGSDSVTVPPWPIVPIFQSTLPGWGATHRRRRDPPAVHISIHAPRMGSDPATPPRSASRPRFQSTLPGWGATGPMPRNRPGTFNFQSTLPGWGATIRAGGGVSCRIYFNPRSPDGERLERSGLPCEFVKFQSTLPGWGATST